MSITVTKREKMAPCPYCSGDIVKMSTKLVGQDGYRVNVFNYTCERCTRHFTLRMHFAYLPTRHDSIRRWNDEFGDGDE